MTTPTVDMHCHLDLYPDPYAQVQAVAQQKAYLLSVTTTPKAWRGTSAIATGHPRINTALGLHPQLAKERKSELALFDRLLPDARYVGEVGLDGGPEFRPFWGDQTQVFEHVLASCAEAGGRVITIHSRAAASHVLDALERHYGYGVAVLHWFSGTRRELTRAIDMGCWFSVGGAMLRSKKGRALTEQMPVNRVVTETDGPFGIVRGKPLQPADCSLAITALADLWSKEKAAVRKQVLSSFRELVSL